MTYALVTHVPTYAAQSAGTVRMTASFHADLLAQATAMRDAGFSLVLATPRHPSPDEKTLAREQFVDVRLADSGVTDAPLPAYRTMPQFVAARGALERSIRQATADADVVQLGAGGHPMALGQFAWPLIDPAQQKRVFVFAGDPVPNRRKAITSGRNPAKRLAKGLAVRTFDTFCRQAVGDADLVFAHDPAVAKRYGRAWNDRCHTFVASPIGDGDLLQTKRAETAGDVLRIVTDSARTAIAGLDHVERAVAKAQRLGAKVTLKASPLSTALLDTADLFMAAPLVPGEIPTIFLAAARGLPMLVYGGAAAAELAEHRGIVSVERGNVDQLADALISATRDRASLAKVGRAALAWAAANSRDAVHRRRAALVRTLVGS